MNQNSIEDCIEDIENFLVCVLREEKKYDSQIKVPTKAQQKKIAMVALGYSSEPCVEDYEKAWGIVEKEAAENTYKRSVKKAEKEGLPIPIPQGKEPLHKKTNSWRNCFLKRRKEDEDFYEENNKKYGCFQPYYKTPSAEQVSWTLNYLDEHQVGWDNNYGTSSNPNVEVINTFIAIFDQLYPELRKVSKSSKVGQKASSSSCLLILIPIIGIGLTFLLSTYL